jgi:hypothetical protein
MDSYAIVNLEFPKIRGKGLQKVAILDRESYKPDRWLFFDTLARNRGFNLGIYHDLKSALEWLLEGLHIEAPA